MKRKRKWNQWIGQRPGSWLGTIRMSGGDAVVTGYLTGRAECRKCRVLHKTGRLWIVGLLVVIWAVWSAAPVRADAAQKHLTLDEIIDLDMPLAGQLTLGFQYANAQRGFIRSNRLSSDPDNPDFNRKINGDFPLAFGENFSPYSGTAFTPGPGAEWDKTKYYLDLGYSQPLGDAMLKFKVYQNNEDRKEKNYSSSDINSAYPDGQLVLDRDVASDRSYGGSMELTKPLGDHELLIGAEHKVLAFGDTTTNYVDLTYNNAPWVTSQDDLSYKSSSEGVCWGYYLQDTWQVSDRWMLTGGLRYDRYENKSIHGSTSPELEDEALTPKLTGTYRPTDNDTVTASFYQALRMPGLPETYWWAEGATYGDPILKEEMVGFIAMHGGRPRHREIEKALSRYRRDGMVRHTTEVEEGLMVWPVN